MKRSQKQGDCQDNKSICKRRRQELFEIVSKENVIGARQNNRYEDNYASGGSKDYNAEDENTLRILSLKEKRKVIKESKIISRGQAKMALQMLENDVKPSKAKLTIERKRLNMLEKHCSKSIHWQEEHELTWDSSMYIIKMIRACILTNNWRNLTFLLLMLLKHKKRYVSYVKQVALLNLMNHPLDFNGEIFEELHKLCMVLTPK